MRFFYFLIKFENNFPGVFSSCDYQGKHFENIKEFHSFFRKAMKVMDDPFKNLT